MSALAPGTLLHGRYTIQSVLGIGGFGITYEGVDNTLSRRVAIKELFLNGSDRSGLSVTNPPGYSTERWSKSITSFLHEARTLASIDDPSIVGVHDYFDENNTAYMVMKFIEGTTLDKYIYEHSGRLSPREAFGFTRQIGRALELLHASNILHRDVKPSNVIVTPAGRAVLIDFGSAREFASDRTVQQTAVATMGFAPPEQYHAFGRKGAFTDVYALAATCYYMLTGEAPGSEIHPLAATSPMMPALLHALAFNPQERTANVPTFLAELENPGLVPPQYAALLAEQFPSAEAPTGAMPRAGIDAPTQPGGAGEFITPPGPAITDSGYQLNRDVTNTLSDYMRQPAQAIPYSGMPLPPVAPITPPPVANTTAVNVTTAPPVRRRSSSMLVAGAGLAIMAIVAIAAFMLFSNNSGNAGTPNQAIVPPSPTLAASPTVAASPTAEASPTLLAIVITPSDTLPPAATDTAIAATHTPLPSDTPEPPTDTPAPAPSDTPAPIPPTDTPLPPAPPTHTPRPVAPPTHTPLPLRPTATPRPPAPPTSTPRPVAPPTSTPKPLPANLGALDLAAYCKRLNDHAAPAYLNGTWACYSFDLANSESANANQACVSQYGGAATAAWTQVDEAASWYCAKNGARVGGLNMTAYCQRLNPLAKYDFDTDPDTTIDPFSRWTCVTPGNVGSLDPTTAAEGCSAQYNVPASAYLQGNQWYCRRQ